MGSAFYRCSPAESTGSPPSLDGAQLNVSAGGAATFDIAGVDLVGIKARRLQNGAQTFEEPGVGTWAINGTTLTFQSAGGSFEGTTQVAVTITDVEDLEATATFSVTVSPGQCPDCQIVVAYSGPVNPATQVLYPEPDASVQLSLSGCQAAGVEWSIDGGPWSLTAAVPIEAFDARSALIGPHSINARFVHEGIACAVPTRTVTVAHSLAWNRNEQRYELQGAPLYLNATNVSAGTAHGGDGYLLDSPGEVPYLNHNAEPFKGRFINLTSGEAGGYDTGGVANAEFYKTLGFNAFRVSMLYHQDEPQRASTGGDPLTWRPDIRQNPISDMMVTCAKAGLINSYTLHEPAPGSQLDDTSGGWADLFISDVFVPAYGQIPVALRDRVMFSPTNEPGRDRDGASNIDPDKIYTGVPATGSVDPLTFDYWADWHIERFNHLIAEAEAAGTPYTGMLVVAMALFGLGIDGPGDIEPSGVLKPDAAAAIDKLIAIYGDRLEFDRHQYSRYTPQKSGGLIVPVPTSTLLATTGNTFEDINAAAYSNRGAAPMIGEVFSKRMTPLSYHDWIGKDTTATGEGGTFETDYLAAMIHVVRMADNPNAFVAPWFGGGSLGSPFWYGDNGHQDGTKGGLPVPYGNHPENINGSWQTDVGQPNSYTFDMVDQYRRTFDNGPFVAAPSNSRNTGLDDHGWYTHLRWRLTASTMYVDLCEAWVRLAYMLDRNLAEGQGVNEDWSRYYNMAVREHPRSQPHLASGDLAQFRVNPKANGATIQWQTSTTAPSSRVSTDVAGFTDVAGETGPTYRFTYNGTPTFVRAAITSNGQTCHTHPAIAGDY